MKINIKKILDKKEYCEKIFMEFLNNKLIRENQSQSFESNLNKSIKNLEFGNFILDEHNYSIKEKLPNKTFYDWCITIYYYALYHAALALSAKAGYESKNHVATITIVTLFYYHKDNILNKEEIRFIIENMGLEKTDIDLIIDSKGLRERASYGADELFELKQAQNMQKETSDLINKIRAFLE